MKNNILDKLMLVDHSKINKKWIYHLLQYLSRDLIFNEKNHTYIVDNKILDSVTGFISEPDEEFNTLEISRKVSENVNSIYYGMKPSQIRENWNLNAMKATRKHKEFEDWLNGTIPDIAYSKILRMNNISPENCLSEVRVYSKKYSLAGTIDIIEVELYKDLKEDFDILIQLFISDIKTFTSITDSRLAHLGKQIYTYCFLLHLQIKSIQDILLKNKIKILVTPGKGVHIKPVSNLTGNIDITDLSTYCEPTFLEIQEEFKQPIINKLKKRLKIINNEGI